MEGFPHIWFTLVYTRSLTNINHAGNLKLLECGICIILFQKSSMNIDVDHSEKIVERYRELSKHLDLLSAFILCATKTRLEQKNKRDYNTYRHKKME